MEFLHCIRSTRLQLVGYGEDAEQERAAGEEDDRLALGSPALGVLVPHCRIVPCEVLGTVEKCSHARSRDTLDLFRPGGPGLSKPGRLQPLRKRASEWMFAAALHRQEEARCPGGVGGMPDRVHHLRTAERECAGLVQHHRVHRSGGLQRVGVPNEDAPARAVADTRDDRRRGREPQRTRAGNHQHRHHREEPVGQSPFGGENDPREQSRDRDPDNHRHEHGCHPVHDVLYPGFAALGVFDHAYDGRKHSISADLLRTHFQGAVLVDRAGVDLVALMLEVRDWFAGEHAFVHIGFPPGYYAIGPDALAGLHREDVSFSDIDCLGLKIHKFAYTGPGCPFRLFLERPPQEYERDNHRRRLKIEVGTEPSRSPDLRGYEIEGAESK